MLALAANTTGPILALIGLGWLSRHRGWLKAGDERVLNAYIYHFALPALFFCNISGLRLDAGSLRLVLASVLPLLLAAAGFSLAGRLLGWSAETRHLLTLSTVFGSLAFFGLPFISFAFGGRADGVAALCAASGSIVGVVTSLVILETHGAGHDLGAWARTLIVARRLARNPLVLAIALGAGVSLSGLSLPAAVQEPLSMLGRTTVTVALFLLGVFLYGKPYGDMKTASALCLLRAALLPLLGLGACALLGITGTERAVVVLLHASPIAIAMIVLSERYDFRRQTVASLLLLSSLGSAFYLNLWLWLLR